MCVRLTATSTRNSRNGIPFHKKFRGLSTFKPDNDTTSNKQTRELSESCFFAISYSLPEKNKTPSCFVDDDVFLFLHLPRLNVQFPCRLYATFHNIFFVL